MYVKNPQLNEIENYRFFLDYVYKKIPEFANSGNYYHIYPDAYEKALKRFTPKLLHFYHEGKVIYQAIPKPISFVQFVKNVDYMFIYRPNYDPNGYRSRFYNIHKTDFREQLKFVKNKSKAHKKELSLKQLQKREWREYKGFQKDQSKNKKFDKPNKNFKTTKNRSFRHKQNQLIREQKFDEIYDEQKFLYYDLWDWV